MLDDDGGEKKVRRREGKRDEGRMGKRPAIIVTYTLPTLFSH